MEKQATKNVQLVLQHFCNKTSWIVMLRVLPHTFKPFNNLICRMTSLACHADVLTGSSRNHWTRDEPLRTFAWQAIALQVWYGWYVQHCYSTRFAAMLQDKLNVFCCPFFCTFTISDSAEASKFPSFLWSKWYKSKPTPPLNIRNPNPWTSRKSRTNCLFHLHLQAGDVKVRICICCCGSVRL